MILPGIGGIFAGYSGTIPVIIGSAQVSSQTSGTSFAPTLPSHTIGDVLLVFVSYHGHTNISAAGWTEEDETVRDPLTPDVGVALYSLTATGTSHTITITNNNNEAIIAHAYKVRNSAGGVEATAAASNDPPSQTASWGAGNALWFAAMASVASSTPPTGFGGTVETTGVGSSGISLITCNKTDTVATLNPVAFSGGGQGCTITAVVQAGIA